MRSCATARRRRTATARRSSASPAPRRAWTRAGAPGVRRVAPPQHGAARRPRPLRTAHELFAAMGADAFADRAARELRPPARQPASAASRRRRAHGPGVPGRATGPRGALEPGDRGAAVHQSADRPISPAQGVRKARHQLAQPVGDRAPGRAEPRAAGRLVRAIDPKTGEVHDSTGVSSVASGRSTVTTSW